MIEGCGVPPTQGTVRVATKRDVSEVAALHGAAIGEGFLSTLGERFLSRLYARIVTSSRGFLLVADNTRREERGRPRIAGFVAGSNEVGRLYREFFWRDGISVAVSSGLRLVRSLPRVVETLRYGATEDTARAGRPSPGDQRRSPEVELLALAVDVGARRRGVGAELVEAFMATARAAGSRSARVVVGAENHRAVALYGRAGFVEVSRFELHSGAQSLLMRVDLPRALP
jgi:ribosomal protein S18 acetylase RimI-like enzyme